MASSIIDRTGDVGQCSISDEIAQRVFDQA
jgi:hypothetical protein